MANGTIKFCIEENDEEESKSIIRINLHQLSDSKEDEEERKSSKVLLPFRGKTHEAPVEHASRYARVVFL